MLGEGTVRTPGLSTPVSGQLPSSQTGAGLHLLLVPVVKLQLLILCVTQLITAVVVGMLLQCEQCCCCDLFLGTNPILERFSVHCRSLQIIAFCPSFCFYTFVIVAQLSIIHQMTDNSVVYINGVFFFW